MENTPAQSSAINQSSFVQVQGHRGCRGLYPENTIEGFIAAVDLGVDVLELDVVISKDSMVLVSHEPWLNPDLFTQADGSSLGLLPFCMLKYNLFSLYYDEIRKYPCGTLPNKNFPNQTKLKSYKPLLREVISKVKEHCINSSKSIPLFNIELKYLAASEGIYHLDAATFAELVLAVTEELEVDQYCSYQAFSLKQLEALHAVHPENLVYLIENEHTLTENLSELTFVPSVYSPDHALLSQEKVKEIQLRSMKCIPWTVNDQSSMKQLMNWGVDGIITDYPDSLLMLKFNSH